jgi:hypothetical protein
MEKFIAMLGFKYRDKVTGFTGTGTSLCFDLYGCVQLALSPELDKEGNIREGKWFDLSRLERLENFRVVDIPDFTPFLKTKVVQFAEAGAGPAEKPAPR